MNFGFTEEQDLLRAEVRKFLDARCPLEQVRTLMETERGHSAEVAALIGCHILAAQPSRTEPAVAA